MLACLALAGCGDRQPAAGAAGSARSSAAGSAAPAGCAVSAEQRERITQLQAEGKLDRAARVGLAALARCPQGGHELWAPVLRVLGELGAVEQVDRLAKEIDASPNASAEAKAALQQARAEVAPWRRPTGELTAARAEARKLYLQATHESDDLRARELFLQAAKKLPPGGPALARAGHAVLRLASKEGRKPSVASAKATASAPAAPTAQPDEAPGKAQEYRAEAQRLFDRAMVALTRSTGQPPVVAPRGRVGPSDNDHTHDWIQSLTLAAGGRLLGFDEYDRVKLIDMITRGTRFEWYERDAELPSLVSADGAIVVIPGRHWLTSCSLVEGSCGSVDASAGLAAAAMASDGRTIATLSREGDVRWLDASTLEPRGSYRPAQGRATAVAVSADGARVHVGLSDGRVVRVRAEDGKEEASRRGDASAVVAMVLAGSGRTLVWASTKTLWLGSAGGDDAAATELTSETGHRAEITRLALASEDMVVVYGLDKWTSDGESASVNWRTLHPLSGPGSDRLPAGGVLGQLEAQANGVLVCDSNGFFGNDFGGYLLSLYFLKAGKEGRAFCPEEPYRTEPGDTVVSYAVDERDAPQPPVMMGAGSSLVLLDRDCSTRAWDLRTGRFLAKSNVFRRNEEGCDVGISADGRQLMRRLQNQGKMLTLELETGAETLAAAPAPGAKTKGAAPKASGSTASALATATIPADAWQVASALPSAALATIVSVKEGQYYVSVPGKPPAVMGKERPDLPPCLGGVRDDALRGRRPTAYNPSPRPAVSASGKLVAYVPECGSVALWDVEAGRVSRTIARPVVSAIAFVGEDLAVGTWEGSVLLERTGKSPLMLTTGLGGPLLRLASLRDGELLAGYVDGGYVHLWSTLDGVQLAKLWGEGGTMAIAPDGSAEIHGELDALAECRFGPFVFPLELCRERLVSEQVLELALARKAVEP